eukprot:scpid27559/ scgid26752/ 72 kDa inositol polyphosphate 5-phosphatase; 5-phosphatase that induces arborization; Phosphatidylinositol 4,5-bisphosphate 5-phosphatase; Phosphatidylinositol polyphosphate 5-phosphatase type IV
MNASGSGGDDKKDKPKPPSPLQPSGQAAEPRRIEREPTSKSLADLDLADYEARQLMYNYRAQPERAGAAGAQPSTTSVRSQSFNPARQQQAMLGASIRSGRVPRAKSGERSRALPIVRDLSPARSGSATVFTSCPDIPGAIPDTGAQTPRQGIRLPAGKKLMPLDADGSRRKGSGMSSPALGLPDISQPSSDLRRSTTRSPLPPIPSTTESHPASFTSGKPGAEPLSHVGQSILSPRSATLARIPQLTSPRAASSSPQSRQKRPVTSEGAGVADEGNLSDPGSSSRTPVATLRLQVTRTRSEGGGMPHPTDAAASQQERSHSRLSDDAFQPSAAESKSAERRGSRVTPWLPAASAVRLLRPVRVSDLREAAHRMNLSQRAREAASSSSTGGRNEVDTVMTFSTQMSSTTGVTAAAAELSDLDIYLPDHKLGLFVSTWNMKGDKVPPSVLDFLLPPGMEEIQDVVVLGSQESPAARKAWEIKIQETLGPSHILLRTVSLGVLYLIVFIRRELLWFVTDIEEDSYATRPGTMIKTKGAVALSLRIFGTSLLFITSHLTAHQANMQDRHNDVGRIATGLRLTDGKEDINVDHAVLAERFDCVFWGGDLNYRCNVTYSEAVALVQSDKLSTLLEHDQLTNAMNTGDVFDGFEEMEITFPPTFKFDVNSDMYDSSTKQRTPSWTDRVLYTSRPSTRVEGLFYGCCQDVYYSDHRPVFALFRVTIRPPACDYLKMSTCPTIGQFNRSVYTEGNTRRLARLTAASKGKTDSESTVCTIL